MSKQKEYTRLPGKGRSVIVFLETLWLGKDHVLAIYSKRLAEDYKRFYFNDIQAILTQKDNHGRFISIIYGILAAFFSLFLLDGWSSFPGITMLFFLLLLLINWLRGPTCKTYIRTAIQTERLPSLHRLKNACRVMDRLKPLIENAQGALGPDDPAFQASARSHGGPPLPRYGQGSPSRSAALKKERGTVHKILFPVLLCDGALSVADLFYNHWIFTALGSAFFMGIGVTVIMAIVRQNNSDLNKNIQNLTWITLFYFIFYFAYSMILNYILALQNTFANPQTAYGNLALMKMLAYMDPFEHEWLLAGFLYSIVGGVSLGTIGLVLFRKRR